MTKLINAFRNFTKVPQNKFYVFTEAVSTAASASKDTSYDEPVRGTYRCSEMVVGCVNGSVRRK
jgi:hypothetical protein